MDTIIDDGMETSVDDGEKYNKADDGMLKYYKQQIAIDLADVID